MSFTLLDLVVAVIVLISALLAMARGLVREVLSIASWVVAAVVAYFAYPTLLGLITPSPIADETLGTIVSVAVIFIIVLIIATYITMKIADFVIDSRIGPVDRILGLAFGAARGLLLVVIAFVFFTWLVPFSEQPNWIANAATRPMLDSLSESLIKILPEDIEAALLDGFQANEDADGTTPGVTEFDNRFGDPATAPAGDLDTNALDRLIQPAPAAPTPAVPVPTTTTPTL